MKCIECQGTGLKDQNNICPVCEGFGGIEAEQLGESLGTPDIEATEDVAQPKVKKVVKKLKK